MKTNATSKLFKRIGSTPDFSLGVAAIVALWFAIAAVAGSAAKGPWLDEFWSVYLADPNLSFANLLRNRWLLDVNPVPANAVYALVSRVSGDDNVVALRVILNLGALLFLIFGTALFWLSSVVRKDFYPLAALLLLGSFGTIELATEFRAYFLQIVTTLVGLQYFHWALSEELLSKRGVLHFVGGTAVVLSLNLQFIASFLTVFGYASLLVVGWFADQRKRVVCLTSLLGLGSVLSVSLALAQYRNVAAVLDVHWISTSTFEALDIYARTTVKLLVSVAAAVAVVIWAIYRHPPPRSALMSRCGVRFAVSIGVAIAVGAVGLLIVNFVEPLITRRYLSPWYPMAAVAVALLVVDAVRNLRSAVLFVGFAALTLVSFRTATIRQERNWLAGLDVVRQVRQQCPETRTIAASGWRFGPHAHSVAGRRETQVIALGVADLARNAGVPVTVLDVATPIRLHPGHCPTLIWVPHVWSFDPGQPASAILRAGQFTVQPDTRPYVAFCSPETLLIRIDSPTGAPLADDLPRLSTCKRGA